jgi:hypothetical protein
VGKDAVLAAAVGDDLALCGQLCEPVGQFLERDVDGAGEVAGGVLRSGADVEDDRVTGAAVWTVGLPPAARWRR